MPTTECSVPQLPCVVPCVVVVWLTSDVDLLLLPPPPPSLLPCRQLVAACLDTDPATRPRVAQVAAAAERILAALNPAAG